MILDCEILI